jgi:hypothetical protein
MNSRKSASRHSTPNMCFASGGICGSRGPFWSIQCAKHRHTIFLLGWDRYRFQKKHDGTHYVELVFLRPVLSMGHVVRCDASGARNVDALFFLLRWERYRFHETCRDNLCQTCVFASGGIGGHIMHCGASRTRYVNALFFVLGWDWCGFYKKASGQVTSNLCFCIQWDILVT